MGSLAAAYDQNRKNPAPGLWRDEVKFLSDWVSDQHTFVSEILERPRKGDNRFNIGVQRNLIKADIGQGFILRVNLKQAS